MPNKNEPRLDGVIYKNIIENKILTESGKKYSFDDRKYLLQPLMDMHPKQVVLKAAQVGMTVTQFLKAMFVAKRYRWDIIYTLPTWADIKNLVGDKMNRIINTNIVLQQMTKDKDTYDQKSISHEDGTQSMIKFRGTLNAKDAMSISSDLNIYDEVDASNQKVLADYSTRLQASENKDPIYGHYEWYFSHPSFPGMGVSQVWEKSDKKKWHIICPHCGDEHWMRYPESIDKEKEEYVCIKCKESYGENTIRAGRWIATAELNEDNQFSGYWIPLFICPWIRAKDILDYEKEKDGEYFYTKVLGLPYVGSDAIVRPEILTKNIRSELNDLSGRIIIGVDTGVTCNGVIGNDQGIFYYWEEKGYNKFEELMERFPEAVAIFDAQGDLVKPRELQEKYSGRIYFAWYNESKKGSDLVKMKEGGKTHGDIVIERNRMINHIIDEFTMGDRITLNGEEEEWQEYIEHWTKGMFKEITYDALERKVERWKKGGTMQDHYVHATVYWRAGMELFSGIKGSIINNTEYRLPTVPTETGTLRPRKKKRDWRDV